MSIVAVAASAEGQLRYPCRLDHSNTRQPSRGRLRGAEGSMRNDTFDEPPVWVNTPNHYEEYRQYWTWSPSSVRQTSVGNDLRHM